MRGRTEGKRSFELVARMGAAGTPCPSDFWAVSVPTGQQAGAGRSLTGTALQACRMAFLASSRRTCCGRREASGTVRESSSAAA